MSLEQKGGEGEGLVSRIFGIIFSNPDAVSREIVRHPSGAVAEVVAHVLIETGEAAKIQVQQIQRTGETNPTS